MSNLKVPLVPAGFFAIVLGVIELGSSWRVGHRIWGLPLAVGDTIVLAGVAIWALLLVLYGLKWLIAPALGKAEIADPVLCCYVGLVGVSTMFAAIGFATWEPLLARLVFTVGAIFTYGFGLWRTGHLWRGNRDHRTTTPVLYLPLVAGSFIFSIGLSNFGLMDWGQLAFGAGLFSWLAIESVLLHRLYTGEPLSDVLRPTLGIQLAPPAVGALAYVDASTGAGDILSHAFIGYAVLQALLLARMLPWIVKRFVPGLWAFSFGATALATVTEILTERGDNGAIASVAVVSFFAANLMVVALVIGTLSLLFRGTLVPPPARTAVRPA